MNYIKPYKVSSRPITAEEAKTYEYIHPKKNPKAEDEKSKIINSVGSNNNLL